MHFLKNTFCSLYFFVRKKKLAISVSCLWNLFILSLQWDRLTSFNYSSGHIMLLYSSLSDQIIGWRIYDANHNTNDEKDSQIIIILLDILARNRAIVVATSIVSIFISHYLFIPSAYNYEAVLQSYSFTTLPISNRSVSFI